MQLASCSTHRTANLTPLNIASTFDYIESTFELLFKACHQALPRFKYFYAPLSRLEKATAFNKATFDHIH